MESLSPELVQAFQVFSPEHLGKSAFREKKALCGQGHPPSSIEAEPTPGDQTMDMDMIVELAAPGVQDHQDAGFGPQPLGVTGKGQQGV